MADDPSESPLPDHHARDGAAVDALRAEKDAARARWRQTHVELDAAARRVEDAVGVEIALEVFAGHRAALHHWIGSEAAFIAARLGFSTQPIPPRQPRAARAARRG